MDAVVRLNFEFVGTKFDSPAYPDMQIANANAKAGNGSEGSIIRKHDRLIRHRAIPFVGHGVSLDDLVQEGRIALLEAVRKWDPSHGATLWTYARKFVLGAMVKCVAREINEPARDLLFVEDREEEGPGTAFDAIAADGPSPEELAELEEDLSILSQEIAALSPAELGILWSIFGDDLDVRTVGAQAGISKSAVDRIKHGALEKLRERMEARA